MDRQCKERADVRRNRHRQNVVGRGIGKTGLPERLQTQYIRYAKLLELLADARQHCETATNRRKLNRNKVLIVDDFGTSSISDDLASDLLTVLEERESVSSVIIASQLLSRSGIAISAAAATQMPSWIGY